MGQEGRQVVQRELRLVGQQGVDQGRAAAVRHVHGLDLQGVLEQFGVELPHAADAGRGVVQFVGTGLQQGHEFGQGLGRYVDVRHQHVRRARQLRDRGEILDRVVAQVAAHQRVGQMGALRRGDQRVAVRLGARHALAADGAAGAVAVFDDDRRAQRLAQRFRVDAADQVDGSACGERHDQGDGAGRVGVGPRGQGQDGCAQARKDEAAARQGRRSGMVLHDALLWSKSDWSILQYALQIEI
ncbi:hypothetical protein D3C72_1528290 [compost metagenome]